MPLVCRRVLQLACILISIPLGESMCTNAVWRKVFVQLEDHDEDAFLTIGHYVMLRMCSWRKIFWKKRLLRVSWERFARDQSLGQRRMWAWNTFSVSNFGQKCLWHQLKCKAKFLFAIWYDLRIIPFLCKRKPSPRIILNGMMALMPFMSATASFQTLFVICDLLYCFSSSRRNGMQSEARSSNSIFGAGHRATVETRRPMLRWNPT